VIVWVVPVRGSAAKGAVGCEFYDSVYDTSQRYAAPWHTSIYAPLWLEIVDVLRTNKTRTVLDLGCGTAQLGACISQHIPELKYAGVDFSESAIELAKTQVEASLMVGDIRDDWIYTEDYDAVVATEVLEHLDDDRAILRKIPEGRLVLFSVPGFNSAAHVRYFTSESDVRKWYGDLFSSLDIRRTKAKAVLWLGWGRV